jgi:geranylgeranylglycerol-phosphate geranylgeranyltransferase
LNSILDRAKKNKNNVCFGSKARSKIVDQYAFPLVWTFLNYVKTRTAPIYCFPFATLITVIMGSQGNIDPYIVVSIVTGSYWLGLATYVYNDLTDLEADRINKTNRPSVTGKATKNQLIVTVWVMFAIGLSLTASINFYTFLISTIFTALGIFYSHPKFNLKDKFPLKTIITATGAGLLSLLGGISVLNTSLSIVCTSLSFFMFYFVLSPLGDIGDINGDRAVGRRTFPIVLGLKQTLLIMLSVPVLIMILAGLIYHVLDMNTVGLFTIIITCIATIAAIFKLSKRLSDVNAIKSFRPKMRYLNVLMQISMLLAFL